MGNLCCPDNQKIILENNSQRKINNENHYYQSSVKHLYVKDEMIKNNTEMKSATKLVKSSRRGESSTISIKSIKNSEQQQFDDKDYILLIGPTGVGKSKLFQQMKLKQVHQQFLNRSKSLGDIRNVDINNETKIFKEGILNNQYIIVDTPSFQLQDDIDTREKVIKQFQDYVQQRKYISSFGIVLNFERTDLMKSKAFQVVKYLRKFMKIISIIIVNMELSENEEEDKKHLRNSFNFMQYNQIIFIKKDMNQKDIIDQLKQITLIKTQIDFDDTIFEMIKIQDEVKIFELLKPLTFQIRQ